MRQMLRGDKMTEELGYLSAKSKRDLFRVNGGSSTVINLEHVTRMNLSENRITFNFFTDGTIVDFESNEIAQNVFEQLIKVWSADVE